MWRRVTLLLSFVGAIVGDFPESLSQSYFYLCMLMYKDLLAEPSLCTPIPLFRRIASLRNTIVKYAA